MGAVTLMVPEGSRLLIGDRVTIGDHGMIAVEYEVNIGSNVMIAELVSIRDSDHGNARTDVPMMDQDFVGAPILIEDDVWIGRGAVLLKGVRIGQGAVIGAHAVVTRDIPSYSVAVGAPARILRQRGVDGQGH